MPTNERPGAQKGRIVPGPDLASLSRERQVREFYSALNKFYSGSDETTGRSVVSYAPSGTGAGALQDLARKNAMLYATVLLPGSTPPGLGDLTQQGVMESLVRTLRLVETSIEANTSARERPAPNTIAYAIEDARRQTLAPALVPLRDDLKELIRKAREGEYQTRGAFARAVQHVLHGSAAAVTMAVREAKAHVDGQKTIIERFDVLGGKA